MASSRVVITVTSLLLRRLSCGRWFLAKRRISSQSRHVRLRADVTCKRLIQLDVVVFQSLSRITVQSYPLLGVGYFRRYHILFRRGQCRLGRQHVEEG